MAGNSPRVEEPLFVSHHVAHYTENDLERERLNWQNRYCTKAICDGQLIYIPNVSLDSGDEILDSATGTGIWLLDVAHQANPNISLTNIDISQRLFPTQYPQNVTFAVHSVTNLLESWSNRFKVANQRLLSAALTHDQWGMAPQEATTSSGPMKHFMDALAAVFINKGLVLDLVESLDQRLKDAGFINIQKRSIALPRLDSQDLDSEFKGLKRLVTATVPVLKPALLATGMFESEDEVDALSKEIDQEWNTPSRFLWSWAVIYAQKPDI
ncbi:hypothetical protein BDP27DRAFT_1419459 [Rhodocollybia butyracea]|uniref:Methyltransferase domain-containing protein n=1 Tax=Rhodocollybia butyracea TaxID=206335 RepID=A0A9P5PRK8_9AGAR|nr:hypothetical protein BDP27DRAFT_1419459 [Rhodocollybia butyracea]